MPTNGKSVNGITGSDKVWFNKGDRRYYLGASKVIKPAGSPPGNGAVLGAPCHHGVDQPIGLASRTVADPC